MTAADREAGREEKRAPVQGYSAGIPWSMHLRAYDAYCKEYGRQDALIDLEGRNCRGGFGTKELDRFIPGWRDELSELAQLRSELAKLREALAAAERRSEHYPAVAGQVIAQRERAEAAESRAASLEAMLGEAAEALGPMEDAANAFPRYADHARVTVAMADARRARALLARLRERGK
jgi:tetratricopeptide (TPR) repeat protein